MGRHHGRADLVIDVGLSSLKLRHGERGLELPLRRGADGQILSDCRSEARESIRQFLEGARRPRLGVSRRGGRPAGSHSAGRGRRRRAVCGLPSRGVSLRSLELPAASRDETERLLSFQLEREFPLPLEQLAYGYRSSAELNGATSPAGDKTQSVLVAALRREALEEYASMFAECGLSVSFVVGSLAASRICSIGSHSVCVLDIGRTHSELVEFVDGSPQTMRCLSWGGETVTAAIAEGLGVRRERAEEIKLTPAESPAASAPGSWGALDVTRRRQAVEAAARDLAAQLRECWRTSPPGRGLPSELVLLGGGSRLPGLPALLERELGGVRCRRVDVAPGIAVSAVTESLQRAHAGYALLRLDAGAKVAAKTDRGTRPAALLAVASLGLRFAPPLLEGTDLDSRIALRRTQLAAQPAVDLELGFLKMVESHQTPYLDVLAAVAGSAPPGSFISELSMSRRGDASLRGRIKNAEQLEEFRKKLSLSGWFERVVIQERAPQKEHMDFSLQAEFRREARVTAAAPKPAAEEPDEKKPAGEKPVEGKSAPEPAEALSERPGAAPAATAAGKSDSGEATRVEGAGETRPEAAGGSPGAPQSAAAEGEAPAPPPGARREETLTAAGKQSASSESANTESAETESTSLKSPQ